MEKISIIIPIYNEKNTLLEILKRVGGADTLGLEKEVILVDDGSTDGTRDLLRGLEAKYKVTYHQKNQGKGAALKTGFHQAMGDIILIQDADLELNPDDYPRLIMPILEKKSKIVFGNRNHKNNPSFLNIYSCGVRILSWLTNLFYGSKLSDVYCGYKVFDSSILKGLDLKSRGFEIEEELAIKPLKLGYQILEAPIAYHPRTRQEGKKIKWQNGLKAIWLIIKYKFIS